MNNTPCSERTSFWKAFSIYNLNLKYMFNYFTEFNLDYVYAEDHQLLSK